MPSGFVYTSAANPPPEFVPPKPLASAIPVFGVPRYRASIPYTALAPRATFGDPQTWLFFAGYEFAHPVWITRQKWESAHNAAGEWMPPAGAEIFAAEPADERCVGEHSVTWERAAPLLASALHLRPLGGRSAFCAGAVGTMVDAHYPGQRRARSGPQLHAHPECQSHRLSRLDQ